MENLNLNRSISASVAFSEEKWQLSTNGKVYRISFEREGKESGLATTLVRYPPQTEFPQHGHPKGEEFYVIQGVFSDEHGDYEEGCYVRNPSGFIHSPFSREGCLIFVRLCQSPDEEKGRTIINSAEQSWSNSALSMKIQEKTLFQGFGMQVKLFKADDLQSVHIPRCELLLLEGSIESSEGVLAMNSWARLVEGENLVKLEAGSLVLAYLN